MRVIGGSAKGRPLRAPQDDRVRPTADRVREAMFDVLMSIDAVFDAQVVDLFAGSGALGLEAASRGASAVTFVEKSPKVAATIEENLQSTGLGEAVRTRVVNTDASLFCRLSQDHFDLALIDPPYQFAMWPELLAELDAGVIVCESDTPIDLGGHFELYRSYRYGTTLVTVAFSLAVVPNGDIS